MLKSLLSRNIALLIVTGLLAQIISVVLLALLMVKPQSERLSGILARNVAAMSDTMATLPPPERARLIARLNRSGALRIIPGNQQPPADRGRPTLLEAQLIQAFVREMADRTTVVWRSNITGQLWVRVQLGGEFYWVSYERPQGLSPTGAIAISLGAGLMLSLGAGVVMQQRVARPMRALAAAADTVGGPEPPTALPEDGPTEIAAVARSFNRMEARLVAQERERAMMLAGISHDLRTPLAKLRLVFALDALPPESAALVDRQLDRLEAMLEQFMDFARAAEQEAPHLVDLSTVIGDAVAMADLVPPPIIAPLPRAMVQIRQQAMERVMVNILRNAAAHGAPPVHIALSLAGQMVQVTVQDAGPGVPDALLHRLTDPFYRLDNARPGDAGAGLGLAIARRAVAADGGDLTLANAVTGGLRVHIRLPLARE